MTQVIQLPKDVVEMVPFADKDDDRHVIRYVRFEGTPEGKYKAIATDGHRMLIVTGLDSRVPTETVHIHRDALAAVKSPKAGEVVSVALNDDVDFTSRGLTFPDYEQVVPKKYAVGPFRCNPAYLADFAKYVRKVFGKNAPIDVVSGGGKDGYDPIIITASEGRVTYILMPVRK